MAIYVRLGTYSELTACFGFHWRSAVLMSSPVSSEDGPAVSYGSTLAPWRATERSQDLSGTGSDSGRSIPLAASGRVSKHPARHGARRNYAVFNDTCPQPAATQPSALLLNGTWSWMHWRS